MASRSSDLYLGVLWATARRWKEIRPSENKQAFYTYSNGHLFVTFGPLGKDDEIEDAHLDSFEDTMTPEILQCRR